MGISGYLKQGATEFFFLTKGPKRLLLAGLRSACVKIAVRGVHNRLNWCNICNFVNFGSGRMTKTWGTVVWTPDDLNGQRKCELILYESDFRNGGPDQ